MEGLFRHNAGHAAINLTLEHINAMQRDFGYTIFPEAWDRAGGPWGDQWYLLRAISMSTYPHSF